MELQATALPENNDPEEVKTVLAPEVIAPELVPAVTNVGLEPETAQGLLNQFAPLFAKAKAVFADAEKISVTDATQVTEIKKARAARLALRVIRIDADHLREKLKADSLRRGNAIQGVYNIIKYAIVPVEEKLEEMEKFAEHAEAARMEKLKVEREEALRPYVINASIYPLGGMDDASWQQFFDGMKSAHEARVEAEKKAEADRIAKEKAEAEESERIRQENERLKREAEERERKEREEREAREKTEAEAKRKRDALQAERVKVLAPYMPQGADARLMDLAVFSEVEFVALLDTQKRQHAEREEKARIAAEEKRASEEAARASEEKARKERAALEAKAKAEKEAAAKAKAEAEEKAREERERAERAEAELRKQREAEEARKAAEEKARRKAAQAPDREKVASFANAVRSLPIPTATSEEGKRIAATITAQVEKFAKWIEEQAAKLGGEAK
ncbi:hypothetical protein OPIT5_04025 [Opitutaceae bacterium TAV5]|nr:hypothetical protein OPIT5_04025 [Opitutaceae bacterium TAV5]